MNTTATPRTDALARNKHALEGPECRKFVPAREMAAMECELIDLRKLVEEIDEKLGMSGFAKHGDLRSFVRQTLENTGKMRPYAFCCNSSDPAVCDCVEKNHGIVRIP